VRLWPLHPRYLDAKGLVALWREALLAQAVLRGRTRGYRHHPQLIRFRQSAKPLGALATYLRAVHAEAARRGYAFDAGRIARANWRGKLSVTRGQLRREREHLLAKLAKRDARYANSLRAATRVDAHPLFRVTAGGVAEWERSGRAGARRRINAARDGVRGARPRPRSTPRRGD
jgi:hypothetical protein